MKIKVEKFIMKQGNRVGKAAIEFEKGDSILAGFHLLGFTICDDEKKGMFVLFPAALTNKNDSHARQGDEQRTNRPYFFLRPSSPELLDNLQDQILDIYDSMTGFNAPRMKGAMREVEASATVNS